ncbi:ATP-dependent RNA helicase DDX42 [Histomonas meleagridis]|uniref:ATP-dependent RNA helicase DDX42 n=1 Tax=Histomonas meleagridis TaxID=135588 RepID=UPI00355AA3B3|nr:ATP-dependent RNA helicase DDX42 [Histomonas meleagridis]KAH0805798.1 ATP-dependent RNA helicase DDX42 [Histomonas meleagridis]
MGDKNEEIDPFDSFFDNLEEKKQEVNIGEFSDESDSEDPEKKIRSFVNPEAYNDQINEEIEPDDNEPEYILPPDHSKIQYPPFQRVITFPEMQAFIDKTNKDEIIEFQTKNEITVTNSDCSPLLSFEPFIQTLPGFDQFLEANKINSPSPVQAQAIPIAFTGKDLIVVSPTGTGKTLCFLLPLIYHVKKCKEQKESENVTGPLSLILAPTELLSHQTALVLHQLIKSTTIKSTEITGGNLKFKQINSIIKGTDIIIATPGRLIKFLRQIDWRFCTFVVVDEADKIFESGFFRQLRSIFDYIRPDRQTMLFGATLPPQINELSNNSLHYPAKVQIGRTGAPQENIEHNFLIFDLPQQKREWLKENLNKFDEGLVLIFVKDKKFCEQLYEELKLETNDIGYVHGQLTKQERDEAFNKFKFGKIRFLISTEIAARGIDINGINTVINLDIPEKPQSYIHRVGRTARAGRSGVAYTLMTPRDGQFAVDLLQHFMASGIEPPENLVDFVDKIQNTPKTAKKLRFDFDF